MGLMVETVMVKAKNAKGHAIIRKVDFVEGVHELYEKGAEKKAEPSKKEYSAPKAEAKVEVKKVEEKKDEKKGYFSTKK